MTLHISRDHSFSVNIVISLVALLMILVSCKGDKEDQALVTKFKEQKKTIEMLEGDLREVRAAIEDIRPPAEFPDLKKLQAEVKEISKKRVTLEAEVRALKAKKTKAEEDLKEYQKNYPIR